MCFRSAIDGRTHPFCRRKSGLDGFISFFRYTGPVRSAIKKFKYRFVRDIADELVSLIPPECFARIERGGIFVPVPLHPKRERGRGFNQSVVVAESLSRISTHAVDTALLRRKKFGVPQADIRGKPERIRNMKQVFEAGVHRPEGDSVYYIVDDVCTTGATLRDAGRALKQAGARTVWGLTIAH